MIYKSLLFQQPRKRKELLQPNKERLRKTESCYYIHLMVKDWMFHQGQ